jgi:hypothetical protein
MRGGCLLHDCGWVVRRVACRGRRVKLLLWRVTCRWWWVAGRGRWVAGRGRWVAGRGRWVAGRGRWVEALARCAAVLLLPCRQVCECNSITASHQLVPACASLCQVQSATASVLASGLCQTAGCKPPSLRKERSWARSPSSSCLVAVDRPDSQQLGSPVRPCCGTLGDAASTRCTNAELPRTGELGCRGCLF